MCCLFVYCLFLKVKVLGSRLYRNNGLRKAEFTHRCLLDFLSFQGGELHALWEMINSEGSPGSYSLLSMMKVMV
jgi:hypothetical protein